MHTTFLANVPCHAFGIGVPTLLPVVTTGFSKMFSLSCIQQVLPKDSACHAHSISVKCFPCHAFSTCVSNTATRGYTASSHKCLACHAFIKSCQRTPPVMHTAFLTNVLPVMHTALVYLTLLQGCAQHFPTDVQPVRNTPSSAKMTPLVMHTEFQQMLSRHAFQHVCA